MILGDENISSSNIFTSMKKYLLLISLFGFLFISSCNSTLNFGKTQKYALDKSEREIQIDQNIVDQYEAIINFNTLNVPLNKYIVGDDYKVFIGVILSANSKTLLSMFQEDKAYNVIDYTLEKGNISILFKKGEAFYYSYLYDSSRDKLSYILTCDTDSSNVQDMYKNKILSKKVLND